MGRGIVFLGDLCPSFHLGLLPECHIYRIEFEFYDAGIVIAIVIIADVGTASVAYDVEKPNQSTL